MSNIMKIQTKKKKFTCLSSLVAQGSNVVTAVARATAVVAVWSLAQELHMLQVRLKKKEKRNEEKRSFLVR